MDTLPELPFDTVVTRDDGRRLTVKQFFALPLARRIRLILEHDLEFFRGDKPVNTRTGLQALMDARRS